MAFVLNIRIGSKNVDKYIKNIQARVQKKIDEKVAAANEAYLNWADTGHEKYIRKKERLEDEADRLDDFIHPEKRIQESWRKVNELEREMDRLKLLLKSVENVVEEEMKYDFPDCHATRRLEEIVKRFKYGV